MNCCALCNEPIDEIDFEVSSVEVINGEYWHADCFAEYFSEVLEKV
ncbi:MAG: hypothetical protein HUU46_06070 [Candidatus Hydrogenedentes bacterium]|nr:hypothetical protein [Candidatus Hydrogenedentota bacterium]